MYSSKIIGTTSLCLLLSLPIVNTAVGQCSVNKTQRPDGEVAYQATGYVSGPLAANENLQVVLMPIIIGGDYSVAGFVRWRNYSRTVSGPIRIILRDGQALQLPPSNQQEMKTGGSNVTSTVYEASSEELSDMMGSPIKTVNLKVGGSWNVLSATSRGDEFSASLSCLKRETNKSLE